MSKMGFGEGYSPATAECKMFVKTEKHCAQRFSKPSEMAATDGKNGKNGSVTGKSDKAAAQMLSIVSEMTSGRMGVETRKKGFDPGFLCASVPPWLKRILHCGVQNVPRNCGSS